MNQKYRILAIAMTIAGSCIVFKRFNPLAGSICREDVSLQKSLYLSKNRR